MGRAAAVGTSCRNGYEDQTPDADADPEAFTLTTCRLGAASIFNCEVGARSWALASRRTRRRSSAVVSMASFCVALDSTLPTIVCTALQSFRSRPQSWRIFLSKNKKYASSTIQNRYAWSINAYHGELVGAKTGVLQLLGIW